MERTNKSGENSNNNDHNNKDKAASVSAAKKRKPPPASAAAAAAAAAAGDDDDNVHYNKSAFENVKIQYSDDKKQALSAAEKKKDGKLCHGVRLRYCICGDKKCSNFMRRWALVGNVNHHTANYVVLPVYKASSTSSSLYTNAYLQRCLMHLHPDWTFEQTLHEMQTKHAVKTGRQVRVKLISHAHFHPRILDYVKLWHGQRKMPLHQKHAIPATLAKLLGMDHPEDRCVAYNLDSYYALPSQSFFNEQFEVDLKQAEQQKAAQESLQRKLQERDARIIALELEIRVLQWKQSANSNTLSSVQQPPPSDQHKNITSPQENTLNEPHLVESESIVEQSQHRTEAPTNEAAVNHNTNDHNQSQYNATQPPQVRTTAATPFLETSEDEDINNDATKRNAPPRHKDEDAPATATATALEQRETKRSRCQIPVPM